MRKRRISYVGALGLALAVAIPGTALATGTQNLNAGFTAKNNAAITFGENASLSKKFSTKGTLRVRVFLTSILGTPPGSDVVNIDFPEEMKFTTKGLDTCTAAEIASKSSADAKAACPKAIVGAGTASANLGPGLDVSGPVDAFNGPKSGANPTILLHSNAAAPITLNGTLIDSPLGSPFGKRLNVPVAVPEGPVPAGIAITDFDTTVSAKIKSSKRADATASKKKKKKKKKTYVSAKCTDGTLSYGSTFDYLPPDADQAPTYEQTCTK